MKLTIAAIVAVSVLMMPTDGTAQNDQPRMIEEEWSCEGEITLTSSCTPNGICYGSMKVGDYPAKNTRFEIAGIERRWDWALNDDGRYDYAFVIKPSSFLNGLFFDFRGGPKNEQGNRTAKPSLQTCTRAE